MPLEVCKSKRAGFTLIEIMVAVVILVILLGAVYGAFHAGNQSTMLIEEDADLHQTARVLLERMNTELSSIYTISGTQGSSLEGESAADNGYPPGFDTLTFTTLSHQPCGEVSLRGDVCTVSYSAQCSKDGKPLGLFATEDYTLGLRLDSTDQNSLTPIQLSNLVVGMNCSYLDPATGEWVSDWVNRTNLPSAVRIELILQSPRKGAQPISVASTVNLPTWAGQQSSTTTTTGTSTGGSGNGQ